MKNMKKLLLVVSTVALIAAGCNSTTTVNTNSTTPPASTSTDTTNTAPTPNATPTPTETPIPPVAETSKTVNVTVVGKNFSFDPGTIKVKKGDAVKITFKNQTGSHDWVVDEFNARTKVIQGGETDTITFVANKTGTFEYYCSVGSHRQMGMKGSLVVE